MSGTAKAGGTPVIICQNVREECRLTPMACKGRRYVELRTCIRNPESGLASPTEKKITVDLELWPQFQAAVSSPETWTRFLPFGNQQLNRNLSRGRLIFPEAALLKGPQEQIFLEHRDFQGIPFIFLKALARTRRGLKISRGDIGPLLWSQFMTGLSRMEKALVDLGWLARNADETKSALRLPSIRKEPQPWQG